MAGGNRTDRISEEVRRELSAVIRELKDPRIQGMLTVVNVDVSSDASFAKVYVSAMEGIETAKLAVKGLTSATGYIRREVGKRLHLRKTPELKFVADDSIERGMGIAKMIGEIVPDEKSDSEND